MNRVNLVVDKTNGKFIALNMKPKDRHIRFVNLEGRYRHRYDFKSLKEFIQYRRDVLNGEEWF